MSAGQDLRTVPVGDGDPPGSSSGSLSGSVVRGASWSGLSRLTTQGLQFVVGLVLARLLTPADFGLMASVYVITGFAVLFFELGLGSALIHAGSPSEEDLSTVFWVNLLGGLVFAALLTAAGPLVADFYGSPQLVLLTPLVALSFAANVGVVHHALLQRRMRFDTCAKIDVVSAVVGQVAMVSCAVSGVGVVSLAVGPVVSSLLDSVLYASAVRWRPRSFVSLPSVRRLWGFSGGMLGSNVVAYWSRNADNLLLGRFSTPTLLGLYNRAYNLMLLPVTQLTGALGAVMFPALAAIRDDPARVRRGYLKTLRLINALTVPMLVGMAAVAPGLVPVLWGDAWRGAVVPLQILCFAGVPQCVSASSSWIYESHGRTGTMFRMGLFGAVLGITCIVAGLSWGVVGVAWGVLVHRWLEAPVALHVSGRVIGLPRGAVLLQGLPVFAAALACGGAAWSLPLLAGWDRTRPWVLVLQVLLGAFVHLLALRLLAPRTAGDLVDLVVGRFPARLTSGPGRVPGIVRRTLGWWGHEPSR